MVFRYAVEFPHVAFRLVPKILDTVDVVLFVCKQFRVIDPHMTEIGDIEGVVAGPGIRVDDAIGQDHAVYDRYQGLCAGVGDHLRVDLAATFEDTEDGDLAGSATASLSLTLAAEVAFVDLDLTGERRGFVQLPGNNLAQTVEEIGRRGLVDAYHIGRRLGRHFSDEKLNQTILLFFR